MRFLFKKKDVPDELPSLITEEKLSELKTISDSDNKIPNKFQPLPNQIALSPAPSSIPKEEAVQQKPIQQLSSFTAKNLNTEDEQGYFKELIKEVMSGSDDVNELDSWYNKKFLPGDIVVQMRQYWEKQQPDVLLKNISGELKTKLIDKTNRLHELEKEWQSTYFDLLAKEELIRKEEKELKNSISEFISIYKNSLARAKKK